MKNFIRGGQVSLHTIRMLKQVIKAVFKWGFILGLSFTSLYSFIKISGFQIYTLLVYGYSKFMTEFGTKDNINVNFIFPDNTSIVIPVNRFIQSPKIIHQVDYVINTIASGLLYSFIITMLVAVAAITYFIFKGKLLNKDNHIRGSKLVNKKTLIKLITKYNKKTKVSSFYKLCNVPYPVHTESRHTLITGAPGKGKTVIITDLIEQIKRRGDRVIIYDKMGVFTKYFYNENVDTLLNPLDARSANWNIFNEAKSSADFNMMAEALIPNKKGVADPFWTDAARVLFSEVCIALSDQGGCTNADLVNMLLKKDLSEVAALIEGTPAQSIIDTRSPKTALSVMSVLATYLRSMRYLKDSGNPFSIRKWVEDDAQTGALFITSRGNQHATLKPLISTWLEVAVNSLLSLDQSCDRKIWIILDELPSLHYLPSLASGLSESRQFGGAFVLSMQLMSQLIDIYGQDGAKSISGLCQTRVMLGAAEESSAEWCARSLGKKEVEEYKEGLSYGAHEMRDGINTNVHRSTQYLVLPSEIINLPEREAYILFAENFPVAKVDVPYVKREEVAERFVEREVVDEDAEFTKDSTASEKPVTTVHEDIIEEPVSKIDIGNLKDIISV